MNKTKGVLNFKQFVPTRVLYTIVVYLDAQDVENLLKVSPRFYSILSEDGVWRKHWRRHFGESNFLYPENTLEGYRNVYLYRRQQEIMFQEEESIAVKNIKWFSPPEFKMLLLDQDDFSQTFKGNKVYSSDLKKLISLSKVSRENKLRKRTSRPKMETPVMQRNFTTEKKTSVELDGVQKIIDDSEVFKKFEEEVKKFKKTISDLEKDEKDFGKEFLVINKQFEGTFEKNKKLQKKKTDSAIVSQKDEYKSKSLEKYKRIVHNTTTDDKKNEWLYTGFNIDSVNLIDGTVCVNSRINYQNSRTLQRSYSFDFLTFSVRSAISSAHESMYFVEKVLKATSEQKGFCSENLIGVSNVYPKYGICENAWMPALGNSTVNIEGETILLKFPQKIFVSEISIFETYNPGQVRKIMFENRGHFFTVWESKKRVKEIISRARIFTPDIQVVKFSTSIVKIEFFPITDSLYAIDAVQLVGSKQLSCELVQPKSPIWEDSMENILQQKKYVTHLKYQHFSYCPHDFKSHAIGRITALNFVLENDKQVVAVIANSLKKNQPKKILLELKYMLDVIIFVKIITSKKYLIVVSRSLDEKYLYNAAIWSLITKTIIKPIRIELDKEINFVECVEGQMLIIVTDFDVIVYKETGNKKWELGKKLTQDSLITSFSVSEEMCRFSDLISISCSDSTVRILNISKNNNELVRKINVEGMICDVKLLALGSIVSVCTLSKREVLFYRVNDGKLVRKVLVQNEKMNVNRICEKNVKFDGKYFVYVEKGSNQFLIGEFDFPRYLIYTKKYQQVKETLGNNDNCTIL